MSKLYKNDLKGCSTRQILDIKDGWRFSIDVYDLGIKEKWYLKNFEKHNWSKIEVPKAWDTYDDALWGYEGIGWYSVEFTVPDIDITNLIRLEFARVNYHSKVWLNELYIGQNIGGYLPFNFNISGLLKKNGTNRLVLRVDNTPKVEWLPATLQIEWMHYGGIIGPVNLAVLPMIHISDISISAVPSYSEENKQSSFVNVEVEVSNLTNDPVNLGIKINIPEKVLRGDINKRIDCPANIVTKKKFSFVLPHAKLWSPNDPFMYVANAMIEKDGKIIDEVFERFGVRKIGTKDSTIFLNNEPLFIKGVNRYEEYGNFGPNPSKELIIKDLKQMKKAGVNFIRVHYPQSPELISLLDEMGFLMMEELPLNWWGLDFHGKKARQTEAILNQAKKELSAMIRRDKNHPSIIIWSMANECKSETRTGKKVMRELLYEAKYLDKTRLVTFVARADTEKERAFELADLVCYNMYYGSVLGEGEICHHKRQLNKRVKIASLKFMKKQHEHFPNKPKLITEFGCRAIKNISGDMHFSEDIQQDYIKTVWEAISNYNDVIGGVIWSWADYYHQKNFSRVTVFGPWGVVTVDRRPKKALQTLKKMFRQRCEHLSKDKNFSHSPIF